jgi:hypothetical protein
VEYIYNLIDKVKISEQKQDVQGDLYKYMLGFLNTAGRARQFCTPRHIIRMMVAMLDPKPGERIGDLAVETCALWWEYNTAQAAVNNMRVTAAVRDLPGHVMEKTEVKGHLLMT